MLVCRPDRGACTVQTERRKPERRDTRGARADLREDRNVATLRRLPAGGIVCMNHGIDRL